jgi:hypothetical protein
MADGRPVLFVYEKLALAMDALAAVGAEPWPAARPQVGGQVDNQMGTGPTDFADAAQAAVAHATAVVAGAAESAEAAAADAAVADAAAVVASAAAAAITDAADAALVRPRTAAGAADKEAAGAAMVLPRSAVDKDAADASADYRR